MRNSIIILLFCFLPLPLFAQDQAGTSTPEKESLSGLVTVTPTIIDEKAKARDILKYAIRLRNETDRYQSVYAMVNDISSTEGMQEFIEPSMLDKTTSLARWITISRGARDIAPGEEIEIPLEIKVDLTAVPGKRYAVVSFPGGSNRVEAQGKTNNADTPKVNINITVEDEIIEKAQVRSFMASKNVYVRFPVDFNIEIENFGNRAITPEGAILVFNRRGEEVASLDIGAGQIGPGVTEKLVSEWTDGRGFGKYKARLEIEYGNKDKRDLQDTIYFWMLPLPMLAVFFLFTIILVAAITVLLFRKTYHHMPHTHFHAAPAQRQAENNGVLNLRGK